MISENTKKQILEKITREQCQTPFYFYDLKNVEKNYLDLKSALGNRFHLYYSMKANPHEEILKTIKAAGAFIDISSLGEMEKAFAAGFTADEMSFVGPGKTQEELETIIERGVGCTVIESAQELERFSSIAKEKKKNPKFCLRVNPDHSLLPTGQNKNFTPSHFGMDEEAILELESFLKAHTHIKWAGLHFYLQSQYLKAEHIIQNFKSFAAIAAKFEDHFQIKFEMINFGGGFGIPYFSGQEPLDLDKMKKEIDSFLVSDDFKKISHVELFAESGRFITGPAGFFVTKVLYTKMSHEKKYAICDGGMTQHQAAIGIGQVVRRNYPVEVLSTGKTKKEKITLVGPSCYSIDILAAEAELPELNPDDLIVIGQSGAYGPTFSPQNFLSRPHAHEYT